MHLKRQKTPKNWPIPRKGTPYIVRPNFNINKGLPILIILRDILKVAQNRKEVKKALVSKHILLNNKVVREESHNALLFDVIKIIPSKKNYRVEILENKKFGIKEIKENEADSKTVRVINKKILKGKKTQINLSDGSNFLSEIDCKTNDSIIINLKKRSIDKCLPLKEKTNAVILEGKHSGKKGIINKIDTKNKIAEVNVEKNKINVLIKQLMVVK
tara:strand:+ start:178 stop:825 length:648 start_codon:yes stop_codon:yes gene_type:complete